MIEVKDLTKYYGRYKAADNINFTVKDGEIVGFLGPNGAGKTTTMNMMTGYISSTSGTVLINGTDILEEPEKAKKYIGYLPDTPPLYGDMRVSEFLNFVCDIKKVPKSDRKDMLTQIMQTVKIEDVKNRVIKNLSKGYRQRVGLAQALVGFPDVLILDEPTVGLDPKQIIEMRKVIKNLGEFHTVILSSHTLSEVSAVCDRIIIINDGVIIEDRNTKDFYSENKNGKTLVTLECSEKEALELFENNNYSDYIDINIENQNNENEISLSIQLKNLSDDELNELENENFDLRAFISGRAASKNIPLLALKSMELTLEDIFLNAINKDLTNIEPDLEDDPKNNVEDDSKNNVEADSNINTDKISGGEE